jgi:hypothetical protein
LFQEFDRPAKQGGRAIKAIFAPDCANAIAATIPAGPPPMTATSYLADASLILISGQLTFPATFSSPLHAVKISPIYAAERRKRGCANRAIPDSSAGK